MAYPPANAPIQRLAYPDLAPLPLSETPEACFAKAATAAKAMPRWKVVSEDPDARRLEAVAVTRLLRWRDDVVIEVRPAPGGCRRFAGCSTGGGARWRGARRGVRRWCCPRGCGPSPFQRQVFGCVG